MTSGDCRASGYCFDAVECKGELLSGIASVDLSHGISSLDSPEKCALSIGNRPLVWRDLS
jgi:hypothetical protein